MEPKQIVAAQLKNHSVGALSSAFILHWSEINGIASNTLQKGRNLREILGQASSREVLAAVRSIHNSDTKLSLKDLEGIFEILLGQEKRQTHGTVYTPEFIIDYLLSEAIAMSWEGKSHLPRILDPFCGCAGFLIGGAEILNRDYGVSCEEAFAQCLIGTDIDALSLRYAGCLIELYQASKGLDLPGPQLNLFEVDTLTTPPAEFRRITSAKNGFDIIGTNPPYVKLQNLTPSYRKELSTQYSDYVSGSFSLALLFLIAGHRLLSRTGTMAIITQNNLFSSLAGRSVRQYLQDQRCLRRIIDFGHRPIFRGVSTYTCLVFLNASEQDHFEYESLAKHAVIDSNILENTDFSQIALSELKPEKWRLARRNHLENLQRIESTGRPLAEEVHIKVGFATLRDAVFLAHQEGPACRVRTLQGNDYIIETEITRPAVKVSDLSSVEDLLSNNLRVIFPYVKSSGRYRIMTEHDLQQRFPLAYAYLLSQKDALIERDKGTKNYEAWYAWGRTQGMTSPGPKLLTKTFSRRPQFMLDPSDQLFCNGYGLFPREISLFDSALRLEVLQTILNSRVMHYYAKLTSFQIEGDYQCYQKNFIERFGVPRLTAEQSEHLLHQEPDQADLMLSHLYDIPWKDLLEVTG